MSFDENPYKQNSEVVFINFTIGSAMLGILRIYQKEVWSISMVLMNEYWW